MSKFMYEVRYKHVLALSQKQLEHISGLHLLTMFIEHIPLLRLPTINPYWLKIFIKKEFEFWNVEELEKKGSINLGKFKIRKCKKGYVIEEKFNWRSKKVITTKYICMKCKKPKKLNWYNFCEKCTKELGGAKGIIKYERRI